MLAHLCVQAFKQLLPGDTVRASVARWSPALMRQHPWDVFLLAGLEKCRPAAVGERGPLTVATQWSTSYLPVVQALARLAS